MDFDWRVAVVLLPIAVAGGWAAYNILQAALKQIQTFISSK